MVAAVLIDIDGVLTLSWKPLPGAVEALNRLRVPYALVTNTTSRTRAWIAGALADGGFRVRLRDVFTAPAVTSGYLVEHHPGARCLLLNSGDILEDLTGLTLAPPDASTVDVVLVGGAGPEFDYATLNAAYHHLQRGATLVAMARNLYWRTEDGLRLDGGAFLVGLEQAAGVEATVVGKPAPEFFETALLGLRTPAADAVMVGDDLDTDVLAAQRAGLTGVLVRTGKFQQRRLDASDDQPDHVIDSFADLPALLDELT
ncbi:HAD-IIA family hydrolase [Actinophytocola sp.]|uniref:HAD-IIA family hydrolase n=1 Tax=Actinophytocola sp. TaxID=1872138 RepID=UPI003D6A03DE